MSENAPEPYEFDPAKCLETREESPPAMITNATINSLIGKGRELLSIYTSKLATKTSIKFVMKMKAASNFFGGYNKTLLPEKGFAEGRQICQCQKDKESCNKHKNVCEWSDAATPAVCTLKHRWLPACSAMPSTGVKPCGACNLAMNGWMAFPVFGGLPTVGAGFGTGPAADRSDSGERRRGRVSHCVKHCPACLLSKVSSKAAELYRDAIYVIDQITTWVHV